MKYFLFFFFLLIYSCSDRDSLKNKEDIVNDNLEFKSIEYFIDGDYVKLTEIVLDTTSFENNSNNFSNLISEPYVNLNNVSYFQNEDNSLSSLIASDSLYVEIPLYIDDYSISLTSKKWKFSNQFILAPPENSPKDTTIVEPYTKTSVIIYIIKREYSTGFKLTYEDKVTNKEVKLFGKWHGCYLDSYRKEIIIANLN